MEKEKKNSRMEQNINMGVHCARRSKSEKVVFDPKLREKEFLIGVDPINILLPLLKF